jgi:hypothetical protein
VRDPLLLWLSMCGDVCLWSGSGYRDAVLSECGRRQRYWRCGCSGTGQGARVQHDLDDAESHQCVTHVLQLWLSVCGVVCLWSGCSYCDAVLSECDHREPDWRCGRTGTGQGARVQHHSDDAGSEQCAIHCTCGCECVVMCACGAVVVIVTPC